MSDNHNDFVRRHMLTVGRDLFNQGTFEQQLVALESLTAGLLCAAIEADPERRDADAYISALMHGVRGRVRKIAERHTQTIYTLGDALPREMARVRDKVMPAYVEMGAAGVFALTFMRQDLDRAAKALAEGDVVEMIRVYALLKEYKL